MFLLSPLFSFPSPPPCRLQTQEEGRKVTPGIWPDLRMGKEGKLFGTGAAGKKNNIFQRMHFGDEMAVFSIFLQENERMLLRVMCSHLDQPREKKRGKLLCVWPKDQRDFLRLSLSLSPTPIRA